jgi:hypothetical protein
MRNLISGFGVGCGFGVGWGFGGQFLFPFLFLFHFKVLLVMLFEENPAKLKISCCFSELWGSYLIGIGGWVGSDFCLEF